MTTCPLCGATTTQPICTPCWKKYAKDLQALATMLPELESVAKREEHIGGRGEGRSHPAFASTPVDLSAMDLLAEATETLQEVGGNAGIWDGTWRSEIKKMLARRKQLVQSPHLVRDRKRVARLVGKIQLRLTPASERLIIGSCLNPDCGMELSVAGPAVEVVRSQCGSLWLVSAVRSARLEHLKDKHFTGTPAEASRYVHRETHMYVTRKAIEMWLLRGSMPNSTRLGDGKWDFDLSDLISHAESMRYSPGRRKSI